MISPTESAVLVSLESTLALLHEAVARWKYPTECDHVASQKRNARREEMIPAGESAKVPQLGSVAQTSKTLAVALSTTQSRSAMVVLPHSSVDVALMGIA
jgi:hypothetical protein